MAWLPKETVVVPVDFSEPSLAAVDTALQLVKDASHVHLIHVLPILSSVEPGVVWDTLSDDTRCQHAENTLRNQFAKPAYKSIHVKAVVGDAGQQIADLAQELKADLIVMPSHGRTGLKRLLIGSVAERVVRLAHCPVLVMRN
jgi:nucleotide-binding universal stress UspA family protein